MRGVVSLPNSFPQEWFSGKKNILRAEYGGHIYTPEDHVFTTAWVTQRLCLTNKTKHAGQISRSIFL